MARRTLIQKNNRPSRFDKYLLLRRAAQNRMSAHTPVRFLRRLGLISDLEAESRPQFTFEELPAESISLIPPSTVSETASQEVSDLQTPSDSAPAEEIRAITQAVVDVGRSAEPDQLREAYQPVSNVRKSSLTSNNAQRPILTLQRSVPPIGAFQERPQKRLSPAAAATAVPPVRRKLTGKPAAAAFTTSERETDKTSRMAATFYSQEPAASLSPVQHFSAAEPVDHFSAAEQRTDVGEPMRRRSVEEPQLISVRRSSSNEVEQIEGPRNSVEPMAASDTTSDSEQPPVAPGFVAPAGRFSQTDQPHRPASPQDRQSPPAVAAAYMVPSETFRLTALTESALCQTDPESHDSGSTETVLEVAATEALIRTAPIEIASHATGQRVPETQSKHTETRVELVTESLVEGRTQNDSTKNDVTVALPPRRARIEEIANEAQSTNRLSPDKPPAAKPKADSPNVYAVSKQRTALKDLESSEPRPSKPAEGLFTKKADVDRSPAAWVEKLRQALNPNATHKSPSNNRAERMPTSHKTELVQSSSAVPTASSRQPESMPDREAPTQLPEKTRRFLKPLVGIDPATVPIFEGPAAAQFAAANQADGVALAETVILKPGPVAETPERLGLLAHELTHIARQRKPRFVPPIVRQPQHVLAAVPVPEHLDEEALARRVEAQVIDIANRATEPPVMTEDAPLMTVDRRTQRSELFPMRDDQPAELAPDADDAAESWGGLPAPWEPLPDWVVALSEGSAKASSSSATVLPNIDVMGSVPMERAEEGRVLNHPAASPPTGAAEPKQSAAPDLDALARQVYLVLKRRLETEYRRSI